MEKLDIQTVGRFLDWTKRKIGLQVSEQKFYFYEHEIWWASLGENIGSEENGKNYQFERPVIVLKKVNKDLLLAVPISTVIKNGSWYCTFNFQGEPRSALLVQTRALSSRRLLRKIGILDPPTFQDVQLALISYIQNETPG